MAKRVSQSWIRPGVKSSSEAMNPSEHWLESAAELAGLGASSIFGDGYTSPS